MDISLIICTRNRCRQLARCLEAVDRITFARSWELVIVDNGSIDQTAVTVDRYRRRFTGQLIYHYETRLGLGNAHNAAMSIAKGELLAFTDDDCYPAPNFLNEIWAIFEDDEELGYISGRIILHDPQDAPIAINESTAPRTFPAGSFISAGLLHGANMAFRRQTLLDIGGFDPIFGPGALFNAEDIDAAGRASADGWKGRYCPEVVVRHHHQRKAVAARRQWKSAGIGIGAYHMKLLLRSGEWRWLSAREVRRRLGMDRRWMLWELVGAATYLCLYLTGRLRGTAVGSGY